MKGNPLKKASYDDIGATLEVLGHWGLTPDDFKKIRQNEKYAKRVVKIFVDVPQSVHDAKKAFGKLSQWIIDRMAWGNFFPEIVKQSGDLIRMPEFPWSPELLQSPCPFENGKKIYETHMAFLGFSSFPFTQSQGLTIAAWRDYLASSDWRNRGLDMYIEKGLLKKKPNFLCKTTCDFRWYLLPKTPIALKNPPPDYEYPTMIVEFTKWVLYHCVCQHEPPDEFKTRNSFSIRKGAVYCADGLVGPTVLAADTSLVNGIMIGTPHPQAYISGIPLSRKLPDAPPDSN